MENAPMLAAIIPSIAIGAGLMMVAYGPKIDEFHRARGDDDFLWFRVPARTRGFITIAAGVVALALGFYFQQR
jgi:hypothetical protein